MLSALAIFAIILAASEDPSGKPRIKLDDEGIAVAEWQWLKIAWRDIQDVRTVTAYKEGTVVVLELVNEAFYRRELERSMSAMMRFNNLWRGSMFSFSVELLDTPKHAVVAEIRRRAKLDLQSRPSSEVDTGGR